MNKLLFYFGMALVASNVSAMIPEQKENDQQSCSQGVKPFPTFPGSEQAKREIDKHDAAFLQLDREEMQCIDKVTRGLKKSGEKIGTLLSRLEELIQQSNDASCTGALEAMRQDLVKVEQLNTECAGYSERLQKIRAEKQQAKQGMRDVRERVNAGFRRALFDIVGGIDFDQSSLGIAGGAFSPRHSADIKGEQGEAPLDTLSDNP